MTTLCKSRLEELTDPDAFIWSAGIEDTFIVDPWPATERILDEYELTGHYEQFGEDLALMAGLGIKVARYGIPWHRINPAQGKWDWEWTDRAIGRLLELGIEPVVDLVHYGVPGWIDDAFVNPDFPKHMAEYAARTAERFKGRVFAYTPLNEPRVTAWYCGKLGWWPPYEKGWRGFARVMRGICRGIVETVEALREVDEEIVPVHVDATDLYETNEAALQGEVERRQDIVFLALDLISGRVTREHSLREWLTELGMTDADFAWFTERAIELPVIGINLYPMFSRKVLAPTARGMRIRMPYSTAEVVERLGEMYWRRYERPIFISETASVGSVKRRGAWLESSMNAVMRLRERGIPLVGYTWWPMLAMVTWAYRQGTNPPEYYLTKMGLWDLKPGADGKLERIETQLVKKYREMIANNCEVAGELKPDEQEVKIC